MKDVGEKFTGKSLSYTMICILWSNVDVGYVDLRFVFVIYYETIRMLVTEHFYRVI